jgi:hypothetical protein
MAGHGHWAMGDVGDGGKADRGVCYHEFGIPPTSPPNICRLLVLNNFLPTTVPVSLQLSLTQRKGLPF